MIWTEAKKHSIQIIFLCSIYLSSQLIFRPEILLHGRLLAEEGSLWWAHSLDNSAISMLFFVAPMTGYFLLNCNLLMIFVKFVPTSFVALTTTWASFLIQTQVAFVFLVLTKGCEWRSRILGFAIIVYSPIFSDAETFANSINSQVYLALIPIIYLALWLSPKARIERIYIYVFVFIAFFSGWYSAILFPLFLVRYLTGEKTGFHRIVTITSAIAFTTQVLVFLYQRQNDLLWPNKGVVRFDSREIFNDLMSILNFLFFGVQGLTHIKWILVGAALLIVIKVFSGFRADRNNRRFSNLHLNKSLWLILIFILEYALIYFGAASQGIGLSGRYVMVPAGTLLLLIAINTKKISDIFSRIPLMVIVLIVQIGISLIQYKNTAEHELIRCLEPCVRWQENVRLVSSGQISTYYFWPFNGGNPDWAISAVTPEIRLSPFQAEVMGVKSSALPPIFLTKLKDPSS